MDIQIVTNYHEDLLLALNRLLPQLSSDSNLLTAEILKKIIASDSSSLIVARENQVVVGMLTLVLSHTPSGMRSRLEDVVVDKDWRGKGIASKLIESAVERAREVKAKTIDLTSRPTRVAANELYQKMGFKRRETNVFRFKVE